MLGAGGVLPAGAGEYDGRGDAEGWCAMQMTVKQAAEHVGVSESLVYAWCKCGMLPHARLGRPGKRGTIRIDQDEFENFLRTMKVSGQPEEDGELTFLK